jgi:ribose 5-phosphate isomerase
METQHLPSNPLSKNSSQELRLPIEVIKKLISRVLRSIKKSNEQADHIESQIEQRKQEATSKMNNHGIYFRFY